MGNVLRVFFSTPDRFRRLHNPLNDPTIQFIIIIIIIIIIITSNTKTSSPVSSSPFSMSQFSVALDRWSSNDVIFGNPQSILLLPFHYIMLILLSEKKKLTSETEYNS
jgi:hypothetical protein